MHRLKSMLLLEFVVSEIPMHRLKSMLLLGASTPYKAVTKDSQQFVSGPMRRNARC